MRVGELLLQHGWVDRDTLAQALIEQRSTGVRLCSLLIACGAVSFDQASRALGELHGTAAALHRHLERRDRALAALLPSDAARSLVALPIGRLGRGSLIVCVRDPSPSLHSALVRLLGEDPVLAVAPARYLERTIEDAYAQRSAVEIDLADLEARVDDAGSGDFPIDIDDPADFAIEVNVDVDVDTDRAAAPMPSRGPPTSRRLPVEIRPVTAPAVRDSLDAVLVAFREVDASEWLFDVAMQYVATSWTSSVLLAIGERRAVGVRGHGKRIKPAVVRTFVVTLAETGLVELARMERRVVDEAPAELGSDHPELAALLEAQQCPIAAPIVTGNDVTHVLVVTEPVATDREEALADLGLLVEAMGEALSRM